MQQLLIRLVSILFILYCSSAGAQNQPEQILNYDSRIFVNKDASIDITEKITVYADQQRIRHGIVRWLPTNYIDSYGAKHASVYRIQTILLNNQPVPYTSNQQRDQFVIYIGDKNSYLTPGQYTYTLQYRVKDGLSFLKDIDELYWNVTGNGWDFPILKVSALIQLPNEVQITQYTAYTGKLAAKEKNYSVARPSANEIQFITTQPLPRGHGITVAVGWPKGVVQKPMVTLIPSIIKVNDQTLAVEVTAILIIYYLVVWLLYGRGIRGGRIIPVSEPPLNLSPAAMRLIYRMGCDLKMFTSALVSMATKKYITIEDQKGIVTLVKTSNSSEILSDDEKDLAYHLFVDNSSIELTQDHRLQIVNAQSSLNSFLTKKFHNVYFMTNTLYLIPGWFFGLVSLFTIIQSVNDDPNAGTSLIMLGFGTLLGIFIFYKAIQTIQFVFWNPSFSSIFSAVFMNAFALAFIGAGISSFTSNYSTIPPLVVGLFIVSMIVNILFFYLMKAPTPAGRTLRDQIKGFKLFLASKQYSGEKSPELFSQFLPYAIALGVENEWEKQFSEVLTKASLPKEPYHPEWYRGKDYSLLHFSRNLNGALCSAVLLSTVSKSSSASGGGGGGSSGGGGGGGGGGGW